jgi:hypothetical protein
MSGSSLGSLEDDGPLIVTQSTALEELFQTEAQRLAVSIPPVHGEPTDMDAIASYELDRV